MDLQIAALLAQDGLTNGAMYALLAIALVLVFTTTRVIFIPQGEFVAYGALTLASLQAGRLPGPAWLLLALAAVAAAQAALECRRAGGGPGAALAAALRWLAVPALAVAAAALAVAHPPALAWQVLLTLALVAPLGPLIYRLAYRPLAQSPVLVLLIVSVAVHLVLTGLGLLFFGAEGARTPAFGEARFEFAGLDVGAQSLWIIGTALALIGTLWLFFRFTLVGKALRATAVNRVGARLVGFSPDRAGTLSFGLAAALGTLSGVLIGPVTTIYYDSGFLVGLKGFVAAIIAGLASYPLALAGALLVGLLESFASFWASEYKEVIVFTLLLPVLLALSLRAHAVDEDE